MSRPALILCADGGGSKVCVVIRASDGLEVRATAGPCNVQSVGYPQAIQALLLATYRALLLLPTTHLPSDLHIPHLDNSTSPPRSRLLLSPRSLPPSRQASPFPSSLNLMNLTHAHNHSISGLGSLKGLNVEVFQYAWFGLAGISTPADVKEFGAVVSDAFCMSMDRIKVSNDVNLLAAPALDEEDVDHVVAVVCGTGTVGRTIKVGRSKREGEIRGLPLQDVGVSRGWGYTLCDEGSAFWLGRLAIRSLLKHADRLASTSIYTSSPPVILPLHRDLLEYFAVSDPMDLIEVVTLSPTTDIASRNALIAGAARTILRHAFPEDYITAKPVSPILDPDTAYIPPTPPDSPELNQEMEPASRSEALQIAREGIKPMIDLTMELIGDGSVVKLEKSILALGGGLMMCRGYRELLLDGLKEKGVEFVGVRIVDDAAGEGARGLARIEFG